MNLARCGNGHFYDEDKYKTCPHCGGGDQGRDNSDTVALNRNDNVTVAVTQGISDQVTSQFAGNGKKTSSLNEAVQKAKANGSVVSDEDSPTVSYYSKAIGSEPVVGWLLCIKGNHLGEDFRLKTGRNFIGRSTGMDVSITGDNTVARDRHAVVVYEPNEHIYLLQPGDSKELCYINGKVALSATEIKVNDVISVGKTELMVFPCCNDVFNWNMVQEKEETN